MLLPEPRGPLSRALIDALGADDPSLLPLPEDIGDIADALADDDLQLALWTCYELHYRGFDEVDDLWEWQPDLIALRLGLEGEVLAALHREVRVPSSDRPVAERLRALVDGDDGPSLSRFVQTRATADQFAEFVVHRSLYQLKEADPHTWAIPRLSGRAKAALVEIQVDEYGNGQLHRMHSELFRTLLRELDLSDEYAAYVDAVPGITLAISNVMSLFGLRRDLRGAIVGHLAAYEMTSSTPCRRYAKGLRRLGGSDAACAFYDEHVTADALHEQLAMHDLCGGLAEAEPDLAEDIVFGAAACLHVDNRFAAYVLGRWDDRTTSLRAPVRPAPRLAHVS
ncbi:MAG: iron-containing redox enzyme family protein [Jatrophihabitans sp.]|uniref:iron-containing redox enzyme family protein n=1 Tax=Jatrophihabitans sp. TaxID=1932789 RepID=UPI003F7D96CC